MNLSHRVRFYQQLAVLARAGVPMRSNFERLRARLPDSEVRVVSAQLNAGHSIADAFAEAGFSPFECHLVAAGDRSAQVEVIFAHLGEFWQRQRRLVQTLVRQLYYPAVVLHLVILASAAVDLINGTWFSFCYDLFSQLAILYACALGCYIAFRLTWKSEVAQYFWLAMPMIGGTLAASYAYRWITALRLEHGAGIPLPEAVADAWRASGFVGSERLAREGEAALRDGQPLAPLLERWRRLPRDWVDFVETGEISGAFDAALENLEAEARHTWAQKESLMSEWVPRLLYFFLLIIAAAQVGALMYRITVAPIKELERSMGG